MIPDNMKTREQLVEELQVLRQRLAQFGKDEIEEALRKSKERFDIAMQATSDGLFDWDLGSNSIYYSPGWKKMLGYEDEELDNDFSVWERLTEPDGVKKSWEMLHDLFEGKRDRFEIEFKMRHKAGHWVDILSRANVVFDEHGKAVRVVGTHIDITERKQAEQALQYEKRRTQQYLDVAGVMLIALDIHQQVILINPKGCEILGYSEEEILGQNWFDTFLPSENIAEIKQVFDRIVSGHIQAVESYENPIVKKDGSERTIAWHNSVLRDSSGKIIGLFSSGEDITERRRAEEILRENEIRFRGLFDTIPSGVAFYQVRNNGESGKDYIITDFNETALRLEGIEKKDVLGKSLFDLRPNIDEFGLIPIFREVWKTGEPAFYPAKIYVDENFSNYYENRVFRLPDGEIVAVFEDVTRRQQAEEDLKLLNQELEQRIEARTVELQETQEKLVRQEKLAVLGQLAGSVAHELRHPLGVLTNAAYFLKMTLTDANETTREYLEMIAAEVQKSDKIISDLLNFSRNQSSEKLLRTPTQLAKLVSEVLAEQPPPEGVEIVREIDPELPPIVVDAQQIKQVLINLICNAYQAMPDGGTLSVSSQQFPISSENTPHELVNTDNCLLITVKDTGCGITPENLEKLFEPLFTTKPKGIGLGLAISKNLIEANGGDIVVESTVGEGSTFTMSFPLECDADEEYASNPGGV